MKRVLILLSEGVEAFEAAAFTDVLGWANTFGAEPIDAVTAGVRLRLKCAFGFEVIPNALLSEVDLTTFDALAVPGGFEAAGFYRDAYSENFLEVIRTFADQGKPIASICVGALPLGKSGILRGRPATTYHLLEGKRRKQLAEMGAEVIDGQLVRDQNVITSTSPATAVDVAFTLLEQLTTRENVEHIRSIMGFSGD